MMKALSIILIPIIAIFFFIFGTGGAMLVATNGHGTFGIPLIIIFCLGTLILYTIAVLDLLSSKKLRIVSVGFFGSIALALISYVAFDSYQESITIADGRGVDLKEYEPFSSDMVAELDGPATLSLTENLPRLDGATALYPIYSAFVQATYPEDDYDVNSPGNSPVVSTQTDAAYERLIAKNADIIFVAGPSATQETMAEQAGVEMRFTPIGKEAFVFFTHEQNPVESLTIDQIQQIYAGTITNWSEVGGANNQIRAFQRPEESGSQTALQNLMGDIPIMDAPTEDRPAGMGGIIQETADYRNSQSSIGFSFRYFSTEMVDDYDIKHLQVNGIDPNVDTIRDDSYPIASEFYAVTLAGEETPEVDALIEWILSPEGQTLVERSGYVPVGATE
ncbi:substrate-binding domain-containing protein [Paenalkalicoccus suaedae]|uniref:Substrate-binding domain-containing protein n=1 Tax=Paenalkalicoccus suaedae TaxID=2592382 RepID=A0A859FDT8_9BACI|nr:substrate-binding domain-containing protein [Paenalkalicoccus suaedae]QKS70396.1 substrate-binding domain-containing protein [Paenalkalicoccus suaedae]